jgi:predicted O-methyltransferase YrrM
MRDADQELWTAVDRYFTDLLLDPVPTPGDGLPPHEVSPPQGALLEVLARATGARRILEIGTLGGYSTSWLARALPPGGRLVTLEVDPTYAEVARAHLPDTVEVIVGPALDTLPRLTGPFDLVFIDADKRNNPAYLHRALKLSRPGTLIVADNVIRAGAVADPDDPDPSVRGVRAFLDALAAEPRIRATAIQTVGVKGHDGFALAVVGLG